MEYKELVEQESQLKKSQVLYIKEVLAQNNGRVEMKYKHQEEFEDESDNETDCFYDQFPVMIAVPGRHGTFNLHVTAVYEDHNGSLRCEGINDNTDSLEKKIYFCDESYFPVTSRTDAMPTVHHVSLMKRSPERCPM